jgi:(p)ppGpp synthase/HD superfamily hydrolase
MDTGRLLERAIALCCASHAGQRYPSPTAEPFILHPLRVMLAVNGLHAKMVAILHDVLEDTAVTVEDLRAEGFPDVVIDAVVVLSRDPGQSYAQYIDDVARNDLARVVKIADVNDNLMNNRRLAQTDDVIERIGRYERALRRLAS